MKFSGYYHRALKASDRRYRRVFERMGYGRRDMRAAEAPKPDDEQDEMTELRAEYQRVVGKRPFMGWSRERLIEKIAGAGGADD